MVKVIYRNNFFFNHMQYLSSTTRIEFKGNGILKLGKGVSTSRNVEFKVNKSSTISIGDSCFFNNHCMVVSHNNVHIGNNCLFGPNVLIFDHDHDFRHQHGLSAGEFKSEPVKIGNNTWVGANVLILKGSSIGDNCVVGAGAIVKGNYPSNSIIVQKQQTEVISY